MDTRDILMVSIYKARNFLGLILLTQNRTYVLTQSNICVIIKADKRKRRDGHSNSSRFLGIIMTVSRKAKQAKKPLTMIRTEILFFRICVKKKLLNLKSENR